MTLLLTVVKKLFDNVVL